MDLNNCIKRGFIRRVKVDKNLINSILGMSMSEEETVKEAKLNRKNISTYCVVAYSSLRQILEAMSLNEGYKVTSHICTGLLLKKKVKDFDVEFFERLRKIRNKISYYGEGVDFETGAELIQNIFKLNKKLRAKLKK